MPRNDTRDEKQCRGCGETKPITDFRLRSDRVGQRIAHCHECHKARKRASYARNREAALANKKRYFTENRDEILAYGKAHRAKPGVRERNAIKQREWRERNPERVRETNRRWQQANRERVRWHVTKWNRANRAYYAAQRAKRRNAFVEYVSIDTLAERDKHRCHICGGFVARNERSIDHLIPISHGGPHAYWNVSLAHRRCNSRRGAGRIPAQLRLDF